MQIVLRVKNKMHEGFFAKCAGRQQRITGRNKRQKELRKKAKERIKNAESVKGEKRCMREKSNVKGKIQKYREK